MDKMGLKKLINKNIIDFSELVLENYNKLGLDETDAVILIKLHNLKQKNITFINPTKLSKMLSISASTTSRRLRSLMERGFVTMELVKTSSGKTTETFNLDYLIDRISRDDFEENNEEKYKTIEKELVTLFEEEFRKPLSVLDIQILTKWLSEDKYSVDAIKDALFQAVKSRKLTMKYVDGILLKQTEEKPKQYAKTTLAKDLKKLWGE